MVIFIFRAVVYPAYLAPQEGNFLTFLPSSLSLFFAIKSNLWQPLVGFSRKQMFKVGLPLPASLLASKMGGGRETEKKR